MKAKRLTETEQLHLEYWTQFREHLRSRHPHLVIDAPKAKHFAHVRLADRLYPFFLSLVNDTVRGRTRVEFMCTDRIGPRTSSACGHATGARSMRNWGA